MVWASALLTYSVYIVYSHNHREMAGLTTATRDIRRAGIVESAWAVFLRYGYRKASMADLARAAGLSRQGLYLHFKTKDELFQAASQHITERVSTAYRAALGREELALHDRLLAAFEAVHGAKVGHPGDRGTDCTIEERSRGEEWELAALERQFIEDVARVLARTGASHLADRTGAGPRDLAETLFATSHGLTSLAATLAEYRQRMGVALRLTLGNSRPSQTRAASNFPS
jgi:AcrR family transcriptional regulator